MNATLNFPQVGGFITSFIRKNKTDIATPPVLDSAVRHPYGPFQFQISLTKDCPLQIEASKDLKNWTKLMNETCSEEKIDYVDSEASRFSRRFYRVSSGALSSRNIIGFATVSIAPGFSMISNPLNAVSNSVGALFPKMPNGTSLSKFDASQFKLSKNSVENGRWTQPQQLLKPGEGAIIFNPTDEFKTLNFVGEVLQGTLSSPIPAGFSIRASLVPQPGRLDTELEFPVSEGDAIHVFDRDRQAYVIHEYPSKEWERNPPVIGVGEAFWVAKNSPGNWSRHLTIPD